VSDSGPRQDAAQPGCLNLSFEEALRRLEEIVEELEGGQMTLEESLRRFEEGMRLRAECLQRLQQAETRIEQILTESAEQTGAELAGNAETENSQ